MKTLTTTVARILFAIPMLIFGMMHFMNAGMMAGMVPLPGGVFWVYLTGLGLVAAAISIFIQKYTKIACLLLAVMLMMFVLTIHLPGVISGDPAKMQMAMPNMLKDMALAGAALLLAGIYNKEN
ncbi:MAG: DoxX family protein [Bacteroidia bacterium]